MLYRSINTHVHCRDQGEAYKTTILEQMTLAKNHGRVAVIDMPNNKPRTLTKSDVETRNYIAHLSGCRKGYYINIGGTKDVKQLEEAVDLVETRDNNVPGIKIFTTGADDDPIVIKHENDLETFHRNLKNLGYSGVLIPHCEDESLFRIGSFNPERPATWDKQRPKEAEVSAIRKMINYAKKADAEYKIHFPHVTCAESIDVIDENTDYVDMSFEVTPQHLLLSTRDMITKKDLDKKMNPPIRSQEVVDILWERLKEIVQDGKIPVTSGTDQAVHTLKEKMEGTVFPDGRIIGYLSGCQGEKYYPSFVQELEIRDFSPTDISNILYGNAKKIFPKIKE